MAAVPGNVRAEVKLITQNADGTLISSSPFSEATVPSSAKRLLEEYCRANHLVENKSEVLLVEQASRQSVEQARTPAAARAAGTALDGSHVIEEGSLLLVIGREETAPPSTTGKCPHSIVAPSVARSSLMWSRCFVSPPSCC